MTDAAAAPAKCQWCGADQQHGWECPRIAALEFHPDGQVKRIEFVKALDPVPALSPETDERYRERLRPIATGSVHADDVERSTGSGLDKIGGFYGLPRGQR